MWKRIIIILCAAVICLTECTDPAKTDQTVIMEPAGPGPHTYLRIKLNQSIYQQTRFGEAPQLAVWLVNPDTEEIKTLYVTHRTATGQWEGKVECKTSLPYWTGRYILEKSLVEAPGYLNPVPDAISSATPKNELILGLPKLNWDITHLYMEVNASGDFNTFYPAVDKNGIPDHDGNGQPSIVLFYILDSNTTGELELQLKGRTAQSYQGGCLNPDISTITSAAYLIESVTKFQKDPVHSR